MKITKLKGCVRYWSGSQNGTQGLHSVSSPSVGQRTPTPKREQALMRACSGVVPSSVSGSTGQSARRLSEPLQRKMLGNQRSLPLLVFSKSTFDGNSL